uniref:Putative methyltransferase-like protein SPBC21C3.07c n=1 Tax=Talaromyces marneffei PM1 TaxID=1077442 RepID=A0A093VIS1_TALMA
MYYTLAGINDLACSLAASYNRTITFSVLFTAMSQSDLSFDDDGDGYRLHDASSTTSMDSDEVYERQMTANLHGRCKVLDIGAGTGNWAVQFADCVRRWDEFLENVYRILKPGGHVELQDYCLTIFYGESRDVGYIRSFIDDLERAAKTRGTPLNMAPHHALHLGNNGFTDIILEKLYVDIHDNLDLIRDTFYAYAIGLLTSHTSWADATVRAAIAANQLRKGDYLILLCAQKPSQNEPNILPARNCRPGADDLGPSMRTGVSKDVVWGQPLHPDIHLYNRVVNLSTQSRITAF